MTGPNIARRTWFLLVLGHAVLIQVITFVLRPTTSYRALELGVPPGWLGLISASFAVVPLVLALPVGRLTDRRGERPIMIAGAVLVLASAVMMLTLGGSLVGLVAGSTVLGTGHLLSVVGEQALVANATSSGRHDTAFGRYTFAASLGQTIGPLLIPLAGGRGTLPNTNAIFATAIAVAVVFLAATCCMPSSQAHSSPREVGHANLRVVLRLPGLLRALFTSSVVLAAVDITLVYLPALGTERDIDSATIGLLLVIRAAASMASRLTLGWLARVLGRRRLMVGSVAVSAVSIGLLAVDMPVALLTVDIAVAGLALGIGQPLTMSWLAEAAPPGLRGTALSLRITGNRLGQVLVPSLVGLVAAGVGVAGVLALSAASLAVAGVASRQFGGGAAAPTEPDDLPLTMHVPEEHR